MSDFWYGNTTTSASAAPKMPSMAELLKAMQEIPKMPTPDVDDKHCTNCKTEWPTVLLYPIRVGAGIAGFDAFLCGRCYAGALALPRGKSL